MLAPHCRKCNVEDNPNWPIIMRDMGQIWGVWDRYEGYGTDMRDMGQIWGVWDRYEGYGTDMRGMGQIWGYGKDMRGMGQIRGVWDKYEGYGTDMVGMGHMWWVWDRYGTDMGQIWDRYGGDAMDIFLVTWVLEILARKLLHVISFFRYQTTTTPCP